VSFFETRTRTPSAPHRNTLAAGLDYLAEAMRWDESDGMLMVPPSIGVADASAYEPCAGWVLTRVRVA
jgi:hypothetical protein